MRKVAIFIIILLILMESYHQLYLSSLVPPMTSKTSYSSGNPLVGEAKYIYGKIKSDDAFLDEEWCEIYYSAACEMELSEFLTLYNDYVSFYGHVNVRELRYFARETENMTMRAVVNRKTKECHVAIFGR